jgi:uncharacterized phiE125 gp8 family phage protein
MKYELVTAPAAEFVTAAMVEAQLGLASGYDAAKIARDISAKRKKAENHCQRAFINQTWRMALDSFPKVKSNNPKGAIYLPMGKVQSITSFVYTDSEGDVITMVADTDYYLDSIGSTARLLPVNTWPSPSSTIPNSILINYVVGFGTSLSAEYSDIIDAVLLDVCDEYETRQVQINAVTGNLYVNKSYEAMLSPYVVHFDPLIND